MATPRDPYATQTSKTITTSIHVTLPVMADTAFRKIDIDKFEEDVLLETDLYEADPRDPATVLEAAKAKSASVRGFLSK